MKIQPRHIYAAIVTFAILMAYLVFSKVPVSVNSFDECAQHYPVMESYPAQCNTPDGKHFVQEVSVPQEVTITGEVVCLPHKNTKGPITLECAFGLKSEGKYYSLSDPAMKYLDLPMGTPITISGKLTKDVSPVYDTVGKIEITSVSK